MKRPKKRFQIFLKYEISVSLTSSMTGVLCLGVRSMAAILALRAADLE